MTARTEQRMLRDRKKLLDSLRAYRAGEIAGVPGEEENHFIESIERRLEVLNAQLGGIPSPFESAGRKKRPLPKPLPRTTRNITPSV